MDGVKSNKINLEDIKKRRDIDLGEIIGSKVEKYFFGIESTLFEICNYLIEAGNQKQNYVLIIDEINRANISRVFGELITLIEADKRSEGNTPIQTILPSGDKFMVPSNLYIIGTMNTADKSIALLDIALRRRFEFVGMYPLYKGDEKLKGAEVHESEFLKKLNDKIIEEGKPDFQIGHSYFMADNEEEFDFEKVMNNKVLPLLMEYFMNNDEFVKEMLKDLVKEKPFGGKKFKFSKSWPLRIVEKKSQPVVANEE